MYRTLDHCSCRSLPAVDRRILPPVMADTLHLDIDAVSKQHASWRGVVVKIGLALVLFVGLFMLFHFVLEPYISAMEDFMDRLGFWGPVLFIAVFLVGTSIFIPESILAIAAGAIFGLWMGLVWVVIAGTITAIMCFWVGRKLLRGRVEGLLGQHPKIKAIDRAASTAGFRLMVLLRLSPLNYTLLNYLLAVSRAKFKPYVLACFGMFPGNFSTVYVGFAARHAADLAADVKSDGGKLPPGDGWVHEVTLFLGLAAAIIATIVVAKIAMRAIRAAADTALSEPAV